MRAFINKKLGQYEAAIEDFKNVTSPALMKEKSLGFQIGKCYLMKNQYEMGMTYLDKEIEGLLVGLKDEPSLRHLLIKILDKKLKNCLPKDYDLFLN